MVIVAAHLPVAVAEGMLRVFTARYPAGGTRKSLGWSRDHGTRPRASNFFFPDYNGFWSTGYGEVSLVGQILPLGYTVLGGTLPFNRAPVWGGLDLWRTQSARVKRERRHGGFPLIKVGETNLGQPPKGGNQGDKGAS